MFGLRRHPLGIAVIAVTAVGVTPAVAGAANGVYGGSTAKSEPIVLTTDTGGKRLKSAVIGWTASCEDGMRYGLGTPVTVEPATPGFDPPPTALVTSKNRRGSFAGTQELGESLGDGVFALSTVKVTGKLTKAAAKGTLQATVDVVDAGGNRITGCRTGTVKYAASRKAGIVYGGATSQGEPVVVRLNAARRAIIDHMMPWGVGCDPGGGFRVVERFRYPLRSGRFGGAFSDPQVFDDGTRANTDYAAEGSVTKKLVKGTFSAKYTETDAAGTQTLSCDTGAISFTARSG